MARGQSEYHRLVSEVMQKLPHTASRHERGEAMRRAAQMWREKRHKRNPSLGKLVKYAAIGTGAYLVYNHFIKKP